MFGNNIIGKVLRQRYKFLGKLGSTLAEDLDVPSRQQCVVKLIEPRERKKKATIGLFQTACISIGEANIGILHNIDQFLRWIWEYLTEGLARERSFREGNC